MDKVNDFKCVCKLGYTGKNCEKSKYLVTGCIVPYLVSQCLRNLYSFVNIVVFAVSGNILTCFLSKTSTIVFPNHASTRGNVLMGYTATLANVSKDSLATTVKQVSK